MYAQTNAKGGFVPPALSTLSQFELFSVRRKDEDEEADDNEEEEEGGGGGRFIQS